MYRLYPDDPPADFSERNCFTYQTTRYHNQQTTFWMFVLMEISYLVYELRFFHFAIASIYLEFPKLILAQPVIWGRNLVTSNRASHVASGSTSALLLHPLAWVEVFRETEKMRLPNPDQNVYTSGLVRGYGKRVNRLMPSELHKIYGAHWYGKHDTKWLSSLGLRTFSVLIRRVGPQWS